MGTAAVGSVFFLALIREQRKTNELLQAQAARDQGPR